MTIVAADDEKGALSLLVNSIKEALPDAQLYSFSYGPDVITYAQSNKVDVAFLDIQLGEMTGLTVAKELKRINPLTNIIFVTGYSEYLGKALSMHASGYIEKPVDAEDIKREMNNLLYPIKDTARIVVKTFGTFEFLVDGKEVEFSRTKAKELLAILIDKRGNYVSRKDLISLLFQDTGLFIEDSNYFTKILASLTESLKKLGIDDIIIRKWNQYSINPSKLSVDSYDYLDGYLYAINSFKGQYMNQYNWAKSLLYKFYNN